MVVATAILLTHELAVRAGGGRGGSAGGSDDSSNEIGKNVVLPVVAGFVGLCILGVTVVFGRKWRRRGEPMYGDRVVGA